MERNYLAETTRTEEKGLIGEMQMVCQWPRYSLTQGCQGLTFGVVQIVGKGSLYPVKVGKHTLGYAFPYTVNGSEKGRKVVTGKDKEEIKAKVYKFLEAKNAEYLEKLEVQRREQEELNRPITFKEASLEWLNQYCLGGLSYSSEEGRECSLKAINKVIGNIPVSMIDNKTVKELMEKCSIKKNGAYYSRSRMDKLQQAFQLVMGYCVKKGYCQVKPDKVPLKMEFTEPDKDTRFLDIEALKAIREAVKDNPRYRTLVTLILFTGMRQEEALALKISDFKPIKGGNVEIDICKTVVEKRNHNYDILHRTKSKRSRRKGYIPNEIYQEIKEYYEGCIEAESKIQKEQRKKSNLEGYIFLNKYMRPINKRTFERNFKDYLSKKGIYFNATLHMLRHSYVSLMLEKENMSIDEIALMIGDSIATTSKIYQSLPDATKEKVCANITQLYNEINIQ
ncbi:MAG: site-specific integrase [Lachnospiraceae bacterium]|nr:site-specific integrase [Lachnospiraceae bacterium]